MKNVLWLSFLAGYWACRFIDGPHVPGVPLWVRGVLAVVTALGAGAAARQYQREVR